MSRPIIVINVCDVQKIIPHFEVSMLSTHKNEARALLKNLGADVDFGIEIQTGLMSRTKFCGDCITDRIVACERTDAAWLLSTNASHEARIFSEDITLRKDISKMTRGVKESHVKKEND